MKQGSNVCLLFLFILSFSCKRGDPTPQFPTSNALEKLGELPAAIPESSGLVLVDSQLWTHNDSGDTPKLYATATTETTLLSSLVINNASHVDWEELTRDEDYLYIGDFGNNRGSRQDLRIYRIAKNDLSSSTAQAEVIEFSYEDQTSFDPNNNHDFDCEAMIALGDSLYLFSKNRKSKNTKLYRLPKTIGTHVAQLQQSFDVEGLVTGAGIDMDTQTLCLLGYEMRGRGFAPFVWMFYDFPERQFFSGKAKRIDLSEITQMEGICSEGNDQFLISSEESKGGGSGQLYRFDAASWK